MTTASPEGPLRTIALGLRRRAEEVRRAEEQFLAFAWREDEGSGEADTAAGGDLAPFALRALHVATEEASFRVQAHLADTGDGTVRALAAVLGVSRLAAVDRVSALTQAGLAGRDLESDRVGITMLGRGVVELVRTVAEGGGEG